ncbi:MAG: hypothetical protein HY698_07715 [Deltaproteobacteria bacterium]|nr:hypothetical protein [Deltaproteobacteria bacterium]
MRPRQRACTPGTLGVVSDRADAFSTCVASFLPVWLPGLGKSKIPFEMFDLARNADGARRMQKLGNLYHRGHDLAWDGRAVLKELLGKYGRIRLPAERRAPISRIFGVIMWGELAAWKISAELADQLVPLEARMAATSQAHDETRHF